MMTVALSAARSNRGTHRSFISLEAPVEDYETLKRLVAEVEEDIRKAEGGNKAAQTRVRKQMQDIKNAAQNVRVKCLTLRDTTASS